MMIKKVTAALAEHGIMPRRSVLVGLSGGADSAALLDIMCKISEAYGFRVYAAHVNHGLRGAAADADETFSKRLAAALGVECFVLHADVRAAAERGGVSEETAGRRVRYDFFERLAREHDIEYIATAHHRNDNAETILMNFMRGSGLRGLCGIRRRRGNIIRPLLDVTRAEIERYCRENNIEYVTDATNADTVYTRNKIRHILIPEIEERFNPSVVETITKNAGLLTDEDDYMAQAADAAYRTVVSGRAADAAALCGLHRAVARRVIRKMTAAVCGTEDVSAEVTDAVLRLAAANRTGTSCDINREAYARLEYGRLVIDRRRGECGEFCYELRVGERLYSPETDCTVTAEPADNRENDGCEYFTPPEGCRMYIRNRRAGDAFMPRGMGGTKKVQDYMVDAKIPRPERSRTGLLLFDDDIAWIIGYRRDRRFDFKKSGIKIRILY